MFPSSQGRVPDTCTQNEQRRVPFHVSAKVDGCSVCVVAFARTHGFLLRSREYSCTPAQPSHPLSPHARPSLLGGNETAHAYRGQVFKVRLTGGLYFSNKRKMFIVLSS